MADPVMNDSGMTELHLAAYHGELDWVENCLRGGLDVHARDHAGYTPLHWVVDMGCVGSSEERERIVEALIAAGADVNATRSDGESVLETAIQSTARRLVDCLKRHGAVRISRRRAGSPAVYKRTPQD